MDLNGLVGSFLCWNHCHSSILSKMRSLNFSYPVIISSSLQTSYKSSIIPLVQRNFFMVNSVLCLAFIVNRTSNFFQISKRMSAQGSSFSGSLSPLGPCPQTQSKSLVTVGAPGELGRGILQDAVMPEAMVCPSSAPSSASLQQNSGSDCGRLNQVHFFFASF